MSHTKFRSPNKLSSSKRNRAKLEYQKFEERKLLAADLTMGPIAVEATGFDVNEIDRQPTESLSQQLRENEATESLEQGLNGLLEVATETSDDGQTTTVLQQTWNGLPVYGSYLTIVQNATGEVVGHRDQTISDIEGYAIDTDPISAEQAIATATVGLGKPTLMESTARSAWFATGNKARLAWIVETSVSNPEGEVVGEYETWVNVFNGDIFATEAQGTSASEQLADPLSEREVQPWVVINDEVGPDGSRAIAAPFDSVVHISVGCTGTLIAPNVVISARHCGIGAGDTINFGDDSSNPDFSINVASSSNPGGGNAGSDFLNGGDVSLHTLVGDVPASVATPMRFIDATDDLVGSTALWIGYGRNGVGSQGSSGADGFRWAGENIIDAYGSAQPIDFGANLFTSDFDDGTAANSTTGSQTPLALEGMGGPGDSGGPMLVNVNGEWVIGAVVSGGTTINSVYGTTGWWTGTSIYRSQIEDLGGEFIVEESEIGFNRDEYFVGDTVNIRLLDFNAVGDITVTVTSDTGDSETVTAAPTEPGIYDISLESASANIVFDDGTIQAEVGDQIQLTYVDTDDGAGNSSTLTDTAILKAVTASELIGVDFDVAADSGSPSNWVTVTGGSNVNLSDIGNEQNDATPVDLSINGTWTGLDVAINTDTVPLHPNSIANINGQIQTSGQPLELVYSDLVASTDYLVYVLSAEGVFDSIEQSVSIQGLGSAVVFEQRFNQGDLFINDQIGDSSRNLEEYAQLITSDINGQIRINITPIDGTQDVVLSGLAVVPDTAGLDAVSDFAVTEEDQLVNVNVTANDVETSGQTITLDSVSTPDNGTATITAEGTVNYTPNNNFVGTDTFQYVVSDTDGNTATGTATIEVTAINDAPQGVFLSSNTVEEDANVGNDVFIGTLTGVDVDNTEHTFTLVTGSGDTDNSDFVISGNSLSLRAGTDLNFDVKPVLSIRVAVSDGELTTEHVLTVDVLRDVAPATAIINSGEAQRSIVTDLVVTFDEIVSLGANPFELVKRGTGGGTVAVTPTVDNSSGRTVVTLTFSGAFVTAAGSLEDGNYQLTVFGDQVTGSGGALDGDNDGVAGGDFVFGDTETDNFFRFFGDSNGDRIVSAIDLLAFRRTWLEDSSESGYNSQFDYDANGVVSAADLLQFRRNYLDRLDFS